MESNYKIGDKVSKKSGSNWHGVVVGFYSTKLTPNGVCVESVLEKGSVQIYPENALELYDMPNNPMDLVYRLENRIKALENAIRFGNSDNPTFKMIRFLADRLVNIYGDSPNLDFIRSANDRAKTLEDVLK